MAILQRLKDIGACQEALETHGRDETLQIAWDTCQRADWMIWLLRKTQEKENKILWVKIALTCAKEVVHLSKDSQNRPQKAIEAVEAYLLNPSEENRKLCKNAAADAADAADAAADAADAAAAAAADATYAAAAAAAAYAATYAAYAAAADAAYAATYAADSREQMKKVLADRIRELYPTFPEGF